MLLIN